jgi:hypothetical protein
MNTIPRKYRARRIPVLTVTLLLAGFSLTAAAANTAPVVLKEMPAKGLLRLGEVIYVDDGKCPVGEVKKITGGNQKTGVGRQVECVKRPEGS